MRALTVWQPWASLIAHGWKPYEFRGWRAPAAFVGERIAIHAGARKPRESEIWEVRCDIEEPGPWGISMDARQFLWETGRHEYSLGAIVATAVLGEPISPAKVASASGFSETRDGQFNWAWPLTDVEMIEPIPCRGAQGFWRYEGDLRG